MFKKSLGQNFLTNPEIVDKIIEAAELKSDDVVIEVGPGTGILTDALIKNAGKVFAVEKDFDLTTKLRKRYENTKNLKITNQDALFFDLSLFENLKYKVVANIPYNITSPLIRKFLNPPVGGEPKPELMVLMVQKEVAERIVAKPGSSERGLLTLIVEYYADAEIVSEVSKENFYPRPSVDSAVIKLKVRKVNKVHKVEEQIFFQVVKAGFSAKRRQIHNSLAATLRLDKEIVLEILKKAGVLPTARAEDLSLEEWQKLTLEFKKFLRPEGEAEEY